MQACDTDLEPRRIPPALEPEQGRPLKSRRRFASLRVILALMLREMTTRYGRTPGGYLWAIAEPVGVIVMLSIGFSLVVRTPSLGTSFMLFYASGYLAFSTYRVIESAVSGAVVFSRPLLYFPAIAWIDAVLARFLLNLLTNALNIILILAGIFWFTGVTLAIDPGPVVEAIALAALLGLGIGSLNCVATGLYPLWGTILRILTQPLMLASAVIYTLEDLPWAAANVLWWNPLVHVTGLMRSGIYATYEPQYISVPYVAGIGLVALAFGLLFLRRYAGEAINQR